MDLGNNKSAGHDGTGNLIVKRVANEIARPLSAILIYL